MVPSLPLLSCESSVSVKENPDRKKKNTQKLCDDFKMHHTFYSTKKVSKLLNTVTFAVNAFEQKFNLKTTKLYSVFSMSFYELGR